MKRSTLSLALCMILTVPIMAAPKRGAMPLKVEGDTVLIIKSLPFKITAPEGDPERTIYFWRVPSDVTAEDDDSNILTVTKAPKGKFTVRCTKVTSTKEGKFTRETGEVVCIVGEGPAPPPDPDLVEVSDVVGKTGTEAKEWLEGLAFKVTIIGEPGNPVTKQSPAAGTKVKQGSQVSLTTSDAPPKDPLVKAISDAFKQEKEADKKQSLLILASVYESGARLTLEKKPATAGNLWAMMTAGEEVGKVKGKVPLVQGVIKEKALFDLPKKSSDKLDDALRTVISRTFESVAKALKEVAK